jgi:hypothetical protein
MAKRIYNLKSELMPNFKDKFDFEDFKKSLDAMGVEEKSVDEIIDDENFNSNGDTFSISFIEFALLNKYLYSMYRNSIPPMTINSYGYTDNVGRINYGGNFDATEGWWFNGKFNDDDNEYIFSTKIFLDNSKELITELHISVKKGISITKLDEKFKELKKLAFNNSEYCGKCIKVKLKDGRFRGIEILEFTKTESKLVLTDVQKRYIEHFVNRLKRGSSARYLLNGQPGSGKTDTIRDIIKLLTPEVTFIIPDFSSCEDLTIILEACEIFDRAVIIMDDIDLYLGSRDNGSYTKLLGEFLSFFDGVKKRKISLLASTNDKGLVDKAAERPGRFNMTLDYTYLTSEQIEAVCKIHLPSKYHVKEIYDALNDRVNGLKANITGAFIANLADNIKEMSEDDENWSLDDTINLITESYKGFYLSQVERNKNTMGFKIN